MKINQPANPSHPPGATHGPRRAKSIFPSARRWLLALCAWLLCAGAPALPAQTINATVDPGTVLVTNYEGWGTSLCWFANVVGGYSNRTNYCSLIFSTLKLNIIRYNIGGGENPNIKNELGFQKNMQGFEPTNGVWNWNADANQRWIMGEALRLGANHVEAFANSPPWWMTVSGSVTGAMGNNGHNDNLQTSYETNFATYLATVVSNLTVLDGVHFDEVTPMNEPEGPWGFATNGNAQEGCHMDSGQQARMVNDLHAALVTAGAATTGIDAPETYSQSDATTALNAYGSAANYVTLLTAHDYGGANPASFYSLETSLNKPGFCEEYTDTDGSGLGFARRIHDDITIGHERAWIVWQAVDNRAGYGFLQNALDNETTTNYTINEKFYTFGQFSEYVRPGSQIININDNYSVGAFNPTNQSLVIVAVNDTGSSLSINYNLSAFGSLPPTVSSTRTSSGGNMVSQPAISVSSQSFAATLPADSVTTFILTNVSLTLSAPATPTGLTAGGGNNQVALNWNPSTGATSYNVQRSTTSGSGYATIASPTTPGYTDFTAVNGTTYYYVVSAVNGSGQSADSSQVSATPAANLIQIGLLNSGFETNTAGTTFAWKVSGGFNGSGTNDVAGWLNAGSTYVSSGVDYAGDGSWATHSGHVSTYCDQGDSGAYQISTYQLNSGDQLTLTWWAKSSWANAGQSVSLLSAASPSGAFSSLTTLATSTAALNNTGNGGAYTQYTLNYTAVAADAGRYVAVAFQAPGTAGSWAAFDDFALQVASGAEVPSPWVSSDIGAVGVAGGATYANSTFNIKGSGADIWNTADAFHYVYQPGGNHCSIQAEVLSVQPTAPWAKAGVMVRESTNANSAYAIMFLAPVTAATTNGVAFQERAATGGSANSTATQPGLSAPYWVRVARNGASFIGSYSPDGTNWTPLATNSITMATNVYIGLPVCSVSNTVLNTATFTNVTASP